MGVIECVRAVQLLVATKGAWCEIQHSVNVPNVHASAARWWWLWSMLAAMRAAPR